MLDLGPEQITRRCSVKKCSNTFQKQPLELFFKKTVLKNFAILTGKHLCRSFFSHKNAALTLAIFSCNFWEIFKNIHLIEHLPGYCLWHLGKFPGTHLERSLVFVKKQAYNHQLYKTFTPLRIFSWKFSENFHNIYFTEYLWTVFSS